LPARSLGAGAVARPLIGTVTIVGMAFASGFAIFLVPVLFVVVERLSHWWQGTPLELAPAAETPVLEDLSAPDRAAGGSG
jgi:hypothetical protein